MIAVHTMRFECVAYKQSPKELIITFNNDRHHAINIEHGMTREQVADNLRYAADNIMRDKYLDEKE